MSTPTRADRRLVEIISTKKRREIFKVISLQKGHFTVAEICEILKSRKADVKVTSVLNVIQSLRYAGFLSEQHEKKKTKSVGRSKKLYCIVDESH